MPGKVLMLRLQARIQRRLWAGESISQGMETGSVVKYRILEREDFLVCWIVFVCFFPLFFFSFD